ncbi:hypothetical protein P3W85_44910 [Cupriavidus basilensis]|uniref:Uncharacterized protein n=1 Tax=Cupriavidus basilensis TaxID=68895 RepID=A0ABT6B558_9BURK|nr:hypothetical protein [Cupriavidus basilensis]MDF3840017.1 hypothetical protein [Cupriavidus basilensis]
MDEEQKEFEAALLRSVKDMAAGKYARKTVFEVDGDKVRRVSEELPPQKSETPYKAG